MSSRNPWDGHTMAYGAPSLPQIEPVPWAPTIIVQQPLQQPLPADLTMVPAHIVDGLVKLLPHLRDALKAAGASGNADECAAVAFLEGVALQRRREQKA